MRTIKNQEFGGERPLYCEHDLYLLSVPDQGQCDLRSLIASDMADDFVEFKA